MGQLTIYLDDKTIKKIEDAAKLEECSLSKWAKSKLTKALEKDWPSGYFDIFGSLKNSELERPKELSYSEDTIREMP